MILTFFQTRVTSLSMKKPAKRKTKHRVVLYESDNFKLISAKKNLKFFSKNDFYFENKFLIEKINKINFIIENNL